MSNETQAAMQARHTEVWQLIPWYVTGRLSASEAAMVAAHLDACPACRREWAAQTELAAAVAAQRPADPALARALARSRARREPAARPPVRRWAVVAVAASVALGVLLLPPTPPAPEADQAAPFQTLTDPAAAGSGALVMLRAQPGTMPEELAALLAAHGLRVVAGPSAEGVYLLGADDAAAANAALLNLSRAPGVSAVARPGH